jgi:hypothetical protein
MRPIPKSLLVHKVTLYTKVSGRWEETLGDDILLEHVRMEPSNQIIRDKQGAEQQLAAVLIYDCKNSRPGGMGFAVDQVVEFNSQRLQIKTVEPLYDGRRLHHYEMGLISYA